VRSLARIDRELLLALAAQGNDQFARMAMAEGFDELIKTEFGEETAFKDEFRSSLRH
jgi:hypothetical protein